MAVNPGSTETNFFRVAGESPFSHRARMQTSAEVVRESLRAFERKKSSVVTGASNRLLIVTLDGVAAALDYVYRRTGDATREYRRPGKGQ